MQGKENDHREPKTLKKVDNCELLSNYLVIMTTKKMPKMPKEFTCEKCDFKCYKKSNFEIHLGTAKHKKQHLTTEEQQKKLECICGKKYKERTALYRHKQKCNYKTPVQIKEQSMWRTLFPSIKKDNGIGHCRRTRSFSI
jgi:hypothetical protein